MTVFFFTIYLLAEAIRPGIQVPPKLLLPIIGLALLWDVILALTLCCIALHSFLGIITLLKHFFLFP
jgi:hypothetical protein